MEHRRHVKRMVSFLSVFLLFYEYAFGSTTCNAAACRPDSVCSLFPFLERMFIQVIASLPWWAHICWIWFFGWILTHGVMRWVLINKEEKLCGRKMSGMSYLMAHGTFPAAAGEMHFGITNAIFVKELPQREALERGIRETLLFYKRFRSIPQGHFWKEVEVSLDNHIKSIEVANDEELQDEMRKVMNCPIPSDRPRWEVGPL